MEGGGGGDRVQGQCYMNKNTNKNKQQIEPSGLFQGFIKTCQDVFFFLLSDIKDQFVERSLCLVQP